MPGYRYADKGEGGKNHEKGHCGKMLLLFGAACMLMTGCGTKESSKMDTKDMTQGMQSFIQNYLRKYLYFFAGG